MTVTFPDGAAFVELGRAPRTRAVDNTQVVAVEVTDPPPPVSAL
jgi:hypothetical protein